MRSIPKVALACSLLAAATAFGVAILSGQRRSEPLRDVVEPITIVDTASWDDGGSHSLAFKDARGVTRYASLMHDLRGNQNLVLGSYLPVHEARILKDHPIGGDEERAFLRLLERWCRDDAEAAWWDRRLGLYYRGEVSLQDLPEGAPSGNDAGFDLKASAVNVLLQLRFRNPA